MPETPPKFLRLHKAIIGSRHKRPFLLSPIQAGFPSPAENYLERVCDLNDLCITNPEATYYARVQGDSMVGDRIEDGDVLVIDCSRDPLQGQVVVVALDGEYTVKRLYLPGGQRRLLLHKPRTYLVVLMASNPRYEPIYVQPDGPLDFVGVVTWVLFKPRTYASTV